MPRTSQYDAAGRQVAVTNALGYVSTSAYDAAGRKTADIDTLGRITQYVYDALGRRTESVFPDGTTKRTVYDSLGLVVAEVDPAGMTNRFEYDALGRLTNVVDALGHSTSYAYNEAGNLVRQQDANGHVTRYEYETCCQRSATVLPLGQRSTTLYNAVNNVAVVTNFNGQVITYDYDANNRLQTKRLPDGSYVEYAYTSTGRRSRISRFDVQRSSMFDVWQFTYDSRDRLLSRTDPDGSSVEYAYDLAGNRTNLTTRNSKLGTRNSTAYSFDALNRLQTVTDPHGGVTTYTYDAANNVTLMTLPNGTSRTNSFDALNRVTNIMHLAPTGVFASFRYTLGPAGNRTAVQENTGRTVQYVYDQLYRLTRESITDPAAGNRAIDYTMDAVGNRLTRVDSLEGTTAYAYDDNDELLTETLVPSPGGEGQGEGVPNPLITNYSYDDNGNTLSRSNATESAVYAWTAENRLIAATVTGTNGVPRQLAYAYDDDGIRVGASVTETGNTTATAYLMDANRPFAQVLEEWTSLTSQPSTLNASYTYGHQLLSQNRAGVRTYYHADHLGSTRALTGQTGSPTDRYAFDSYGRTLRQTGPTENAYLFAGEQRDKQLGLDYLRARYLNFGAGRFLGADPINGNMRLPQSGNRYLYARANPVMFLDPSGEFTLPDIVATLAIVSHLETYEGAYARAGHRAVLRTANVACGILQPGAALQSLGLEMVETDLPRGIELYTLGRNLTAVGFEATRAILGRVYPETLDPVQLKGEIDAYFVSIKVDLRFLEGTISLDKNTLVKYGNFDEQLENLLKDVKAYLDSDKFISSVINQGASCKLSEEAKRIFDGSSKLIDWLHLKGPTEFKWSTKDDEEE